MKAILVANNIHNYIHIVRGHKVMLDQDLAALYEVPTKALIQAVKRNTDRFPIDFMFQLNKSEALAMRSQNVTASKRNLNSKPFVFTEQGVSMLSSVLRSKRAVQVNIAIMRAFVYLRGILSTNERMVKKIELLEEQLKKHDKRFKKHASQIKMVFEAIREMMVQNQ